VEDTLKRLLDAELRAEKLVEEARKKQDDIGRQAIADARRAEQRFESRIPEIHGSFLEKAEEQAAQAMLELERRYQERKARLRELAEARRQEAIEAAIRLLLDPSQG
jgi:vacuolar-type H+-ATPase subunit H